MSYIELLRRLYASTQNGMKLGLDNMHRLNEAMGFPDKSFRTIHVAGTNGKGSVTTKIAKAHEALGLRVGLYTSPHIATFRERIRVNGAMISECQVEAILQDIFQLIDERNIPATFFEITTMLALKYFALEKVDIAALETGLGGRLDATNIVAPVLSVITSISLDHTEVLGDTLESIAIEKAGIIKQKIPVVIGPRVPISPVKAIADTMQSECIQVSGAFANFEEENRAVAKRALESLGIAPAAITEGLQAIPLCRMQIFDRQQLKNCKIQPLPKAVILDVAHNPDGLEQLFRSARHKFPHDGFRVVCALSKNKDIEACLKLIKQNASFIQLTEAANPRAAKAAELKSALLSLGASPSDISFGLNVQESIWHGLAAAADHDQVLLVCGTFFIMAEARAALGIQEPSDPFPLGEFLYSKKM